MGRLGVLGFVVALVATTPAVAQEIGTPDGRVRVGVDAGPTGPDSGAVRVSGNAGTYHVDHSLEGDASPDDGCSYLRATNPPMFEAVGTCGGEREELYGPAVARASLGTGALTAGIKHDGTLTNLAWPGPGFYDHVNYLNRSRDLPNHGAAENAGSFAGLLLPDGSATWFSAFDGWEVADQRYDGPESGVLRTVLTHEGFGATVTIRDVVHPTLDVLARRVDVEGAPEGARLAYYANMNPTTGRVPRTPSVTDGAADDASDFATVYAGDAGVMLHFRPYRLDATAATVAATGRLGVENTTAALAGTFGTGVYIAVGGDDRPAEYQAGVDSSGLVRGEAEGTGALDPYHDADDGSLSNSVAAIGRTAGAQAWSSTSGTVYLTAADDPLAAAALVDQARRQGFERIRRAAERDWQQWLRHVRLPDTGDPRVADVSKRALMLIRTAQDRRSGAIVANTTTQTPYRQDWVRDGSFFNYALLLAGTRETVAMVERHNDFYRRAQSETGHWDPILCTDGAHCSAVFPFEIDAQAFGVWALWLEYEFTGNLDRLRLNYEAIRKGALVLEVCRDPATGLQCYASEDDHVQPSQGPQGAATVYLGLRSAAAAARLVGDPEDAARWDARADELRTAARAAFCDGTCRTGRGYMVWPSGLLMADDDGTPEHPDLQATLDAVGDTLRRRIAFELPAPGGFFQYPMEPMFGLAAAWSETPDHDALLVDGVRWLTHDVVEPGVDHFGERIFHLGGGEYLHTVGFPHIWSGAETYIAAALVHGLDRGVGP